MGRNKVVIDETRYIIFGFDAPCGGYFAEFYDTGSKKYKEEDAASDEIGFFQGVSKNRVLEFFEKHGALDAARKQVPAAWSNLCLDLPC